jgi:hypothetical protein
MFVQSRWIRILICALQFKQIQIINDDYFWTIFDICLLIVWHTDKLYIFGKSRTWLIEISMSSLSSVVTLWDNLGQRSNPYLCSIFYTHHRIPNETMMTINVDTIANTYEVIYVIKTAFIDQRLPNLVQRLFANVIYDAIWLMNIHEQKYLWK